MDKRKKKRRRLIFIGAGAVFLLLLVVVVSAVAFRGEPATLVQIGKVERLSELISKVNASGEIKPKEYVELQAEITGVINELYVKEGDFVEKGSLLLRIDPTQTEAQTRAQQAILEAALIDANTQQSQISVQEANLNRERSNVRAAEAEVDRNRQALELAENNFRRKQELFEANLISRDLYEAARNEKVGAQAGLTTAEARLDQAQAGLEVAKVVLEQNRNSYQSSLSRVAQYRAGLEQAQDNLAKTTIRSPLTGVITQLNVEVGERAVPGTLNNPSATIMVIADLSVIEAEVEVDETDIVELELGQVAEVNVDALPDQTLAGTVTEIGNSAIPKANSQEAKDFKVVIRLNAPPKTLRPGLSCTADITTAVRENAIAIPIQALTVREFEVDVNGEPTEIAEADEEETSRKRNLKDVQGVFVVKEGKAEFAPVETGISGDTDLEVVTGVEEDTEIITGSYKALRSLKNGTAVRVADQKRT